MELIFVVLVIWNLLITACMLGLFFQFRDMQYQLAILHTQHINQILEDK